MIIKFHQSHNPTFDGITRKVLLQAVFVGVRHFTIHAPERIIFGVRLLMAGVVSVILKFKFKLQLHFSISFCSFNTGRDVSKTRKASDSRSCKPTDMATCFLFCAILKIWNAKSSSQIGAFFLPDVCQLSSRKNDVGSREDFFPRMLKTAKKVPKSQKRQQCQDCRDCQGCQDCRDCRNCGDCRD